MRIFLISLLVLVSLPVAADNIWINQKSSEVVSATSAIIEVGTKTRGYTMGTASDGQGGSSAYCFVMTDGKTWNECSTNLTGKMKFVIPVRILSDGRLVGVIKEIQGISVLSSFIISEDMVNFLPVYFFNSSDPDDQPAGYDESLSVLGDNVWLGLKNGKVKKSTDLGKTWENIVVTADTEMEISVVKFKDTMNGIAAGGVITESTGSEGETVYDVNAKGSIFRTADGGATWTPLVQNLEMFPYDIIETSSGRIYLLYDDDDSKNDTSAGRKNVVWSDDSFTTFSGWDESFDIAVSTGKFSMNSALDMDEGAVDEIWISGYCGSGFNFKPCTIDTTDGGATWFDKLVLGAGKLGPISVLDSNHVYTAAMSKSIWKWGDPDEDFSEPEVPDEAESPDDAAVTDDQTVDDSQVHDDTVTQNDNEETADDLPVDDEDDAGCGCSIVY